MLPKISCRSFPLILNSNDYVIWTIQHLQVQNIASNWIAKFSPIVLKLKPFFLLKKQALKKIRSISQFLLLPVRGETLKWDLHFQIVSKSG